MAQLQHQEPIPSPVLGPEEGYTTLLEKYQERGREIKALRKINNQLEEELKLAKAEVITKYGKILLVLCVFDYS